MDLNTRIEHYPKSIGLFSETDGQQLGVIGAGDGQVREVALRIAEEEMPNIFDRLFASAQSYRIIKDLDRTNGWGEPCSRAEAEAASQNHNYAILFLDSRMPHYRTKGLALSIFSVIPVNIRPDRILRCLSP